MRAEGVDYCGPVRVENESVTRAYDARSTASAGSAKPSLYVLRRDREESQCRTSEDTSWSRTWACRQRWQTM